MHLDIYLHALFLTANLIEPTGTIIFQSSMSPGKLQDFENEKLDQISSLSTSILELRKRHAQLSIEKENLMKDKCLKFKEARIAEFEQKTTAIDEKERELCRKTKQLVDDLFGTCEDTPFHKALIQILSNLKGKLENALKIFSRHNETRQHMFFRKIELGQ